MVILLVSRCISSNEIWTLERTRSCEEALRLNHGVADVQAASVYWSEEIRSCAVIYLWPRRHIVVSLTLIVGFNLLFMLLFPKRSKSGHCLGRIRSREQVVSIICDGDCLLFHSVTEVVDYFVNIRAEHLVLVIG